MDYTFDSQGRMKTITTWQNAATATTAWNYDPYRGLLTNKLYANSHGPSYTNTAAGRLGKRAWARGVNTFYTYDTAGDLAKILYSDVTPAVTSSYGRAGRRMTDCTYNSAEDLTTVEPRPAGVVNWAFRPSPD